MCIKLTFLMGVCVCVIGYANCTDVFPIYIGDDRTDEDAFKVGFVYQTVSWTVVRGFLMSIFGTNLGTKREGTRFWHSCI